MIIQCVITLHFWTDNARIPSYFPSNVSYSVFRLSFDCLQSAIITAFLIYSEYNHIQLIFVVLI